MDPVGIGRDIFLIESERVSLLPDHLVTLLDSQQDGIHIDFLPFVFQILEGGFVGREPQFHPGDLHPLGGEEIPAGEHQREQRQKEQNYLVRLHPYPKSGVKVTNLLSL